MERKELTLPEIQQEMLKMAIKIDEICEKIDIRYCLAYGSLIGAIRHNGFIPWDDDMDVWMTKPDLDRFTEYCETHAEEIKPFKLCTRANTKNYSYYIPRFANFDYEYINTDPHQAQFDIGIFVDIYPIEGYGNTIEEAKELDCKCQRLNKLYDIYINPRSETIIKSLARKVIYFALHLIYPNEYYRVQEKEFENILSKHKDLNCKYVGLVRWVDFFTLHKRDDIFDTRGQFKVTKHKFEGYTFYIPECYHSILTQFYGDYMKLPPSEKRVPHHDYKIYKRKNKGL